MYAAYSEDAILILARELIRERAANPALAVIRKERKPRRSRNNVPVMEAQLERARTLALGFVYG